MGAPDDEARVRIEAIVAAIRAGIEELQSSFPNPATVRIALLVRLTDLPGPAMVYSNDEMGDAAAALILWGEMVRLMEWEDDGKRH